MNGSTRFAVLLATASLLCCQVAVAADGADAKPETQPSGNPPKFVSKAASAVARVGGAAGHGIEHGAKAAASGVERGAHAVGRGVHRAASATVNGVEHGAHAVAKGVEKGAKATGDAAHKAADKVSPSASSDASVPVEDKK